MARCTYAVLAALILSTLFPLVTARQVHAEQPEAQGEATQVSSASPSWTVTVDPLTTALGFVHVQVERRVLDRFSAYLGPSLRLYDPVFSSDHEPYRGYGVEGGVRCFPLGEAPSGLWVMARGVGARVVLSDPEDEGQAAWGGYISGLVGYTLLPWRRLVVAGGVGVQYFRYEVADYGIRGIAPALHTNVGIAF